MSKARRPAPSRARAPAAGERHGSLATYRAKRDFSRSPEPAGRKGRGNGERFFCIQKHLASHLHYDFRLEHAGVLLSWAVPKGPSVDPSTKRLAMQVEDHPLDYGTFEGVIPEGYGAGIVVLWDRGVWQPLVEDVGAALRRCNLPFVVLGEKIKGAWTLIRASRAGPKAWLLVKQRDEWAGGEEPTVTDPGSVTGSGDFAAVLARDRANPWPDEPPVRGGETGKLFRAVIAEAAALAKKRGRRGKPGARWTSAGVPS
jgi:bifunctional non-homologous end joining protein LigD